MTETALIGPVEAPWLQVMSYNIRRRLPHLSPMSPDRWERRRPLLARLLASEQPALLGIQEALPDQAEFVLTSLSSSYRFVGYGRKSDRSGEGCPLFYDSDRLQLVEWKQTALSATPDVPGSMTWGNRVPRIAVSGVFRDRSTGKEFLAVNTHFDHLSTASRLRSAEAIRQLVAASKRPALVTGDFNTDAHTAPHSALLEGGVLRDSWLVGERLTESWGTFPNYRAPHHERKRIDWILATPTFDVLKAAINVTQYEGAWASDHTPVQAVVALR